MNIYISESEVMKTLQAQFAKGVKPNLFIVKHSMNQHNPNRIFLRVANQVKLDCITCHVEKKAYIDLNTKIVVELEDEPLNAQVFCHLEAFKSHSLNIIADSNQSIKEILSESELSSFSTKSIDQLLLNMSLKDLCIVCSHESNYYCELCETNLIHCCPTCNSEVTYEEAYISNNDEYVAACLVCDCDLLGIEVMKTHPLEFTGNRLKAVLKEKGFTPK